MTAEPLTPAPPAATLHALPTGGAPAPETARSPLQPPYFAPDAPLHLADGRTLFAGAVYAAVPGFRTLQLDVWVPAPAAARPAAPPLVLWIHGGAWMTGDRRHLPPTLRPNQVFDALTAAGLAVATLDYRHSSEAPFPAQLHDAKAALRYLHRFADTFGVDTTRAGVWGESAGGHLASLVALTAHRPDLAGARPPGVPGPDLPVQAAAVWYGVADLPTVPHVPLPPEIAATAAPEFAQDPMQALLRDADAATRADASPLGHVTAAAAAPGLPTFLLQHGTADWLVPCDQSVRLHEALVAAGATSTLDLVEGAGHCFFDHDDVTGVLDRAVAFLAGQLLA